MHAIGKEFGFSAAHMLPHLGAGHKCKNLHGHNYTVRIELTAQATDARGFVVDYGELSPIKDYIDNNLDHAFIIGDSEVEKEIAGIGGRYYMLGGVVSSAENIAEHLYHVIKNKFPDIGKLLHTVSVSETGKTWAVYHE